MHELLMIVRNCAVHDPGCGRRVMRPGAIYNADENTARILVERGYAMRVVEPAPLFVDSTAAPGKPKKAKRRDSTDGSINDGTHNPS